MGRNYTRQEAIDLIDSILTTVTHELQWQEQHREGGEISELEWYLENNVQALQELYKKIDIKKELADTDNKGIAAILNKCIPVATLFKLVNVPQDGFYINEDFKELLDLTPEKDRSIFSKKRTDIYVGHDKSYVDICSTIDGEVQALALFLGIPLQESLSDGLNILGDFCLEHNKTFFLGLPWLIGKGLKQGGKVLSETNIPSLTNNIVFTKKVLDSLCDTYFAENEKFKKNLINDSIKELTTDEQSEIKKFIKKFIDIVVF